MKRTTSYGVFAAGLLLAVFGFVALAHTHQAASDGIAVTMVHEYDDTDTYNVNASYPQFGIPNVDAVIKQSVTDAITELENYPPNPPDSATPQNQFIGLVNSVYVGPKIISTELVYSDNTGGAHPNATIAGINVNRATGTELSLNDALSLIGMNLQQVASSSATQLQAQLGQDFISPEGAEPAPDNYSTFIVSTSTVSFIFQEYQVAPYSDGTPRVSFARKN